MAAAAKQTFYVAQAVYAKAKKARYESTQSRWLDYSFQLWTVHVAKSLDEAILVASTEPRAAVVMDEVTFLNLQFVTEWWTRAPFEAAIAQAQYRNDVPLSEEVAERPTVTTQILVDKKTRTVRRLELPEVTEIVGVDDLEGSCCPHCGAEGRFIVRFKCADGSYRGAMRGCFKLFPQARNLQGRWHLQAAR